MKSYPKMTIEEKRRYAKPLFQCGRCGDWLASAAADEHAIRCRHRPPPSRVK